MLDENQAHEGPQDFELVELLFKDVTAIQNQPGLSSSNSPQNQEPLDLSFKVRFQSFINQIPSYLHSSEKEGFFSHFFLGNFSTLLHTKLSEKLEIKNIYFRFDGSKTLKVVAKKKHKTHVFIFTEDSEEKHPDSKQTVINKFEFTKGELRAIGVDYNTIDKKNLDLKLIKINKLMVENKKNITVQVTSKKIHNSDVFPPAQYPFKEITKKLSVGCLEDYIEQLSSSNQRLVKENFDKLLTDVQRIHKDLNLPDGVYGERAREANQHGFLTGVLDNFRYRYNAKIYLEQFAGRGYADIVLLVRGPGRVINAIPIIIELKAGQESKSRKRNTYGARVIPSVTPENALYQAKDYAEGFQPNKLRVLTLARYVICAGINLDDTSVETFRTALVPIVQPQRPLIGSLLESVKRFSNGNINENNLKKEINLSISREYYTFPPTPEKSNDFYFSRFLLGQVIPIDNDDFERHVFIHGEVTLKDKQASSRPVRQATKKPKGFYEEIDNNRKNDITTIIFLPKKKQQHAILLNIIENHEGDFPRINLDSIANQLANKKIIELNVWFNTSQKPNSEGNEFEDYLTIKDINLHNSSQDYSTVNLNHVYDGEFKQISCPVSFKETFDNAIESQKQHLDKWSVFSSQDYQNLFGEIGECIFHFKDIIKGETPTQERDEEDSEIGSYKKKYEALIQAVLHGLFNHYSDSKLIEHPGNIELVATEFQTGAGSRIDMMIQGIGNTPQGIREYIPVGIELKWGELNEDQKEDLILQIRRYAEGAAIKAITDSPKVVIMGIDFNDQAQTPMALFVMVDSTSSLVDHSSIRVFPVIELKQNAPIILSGIVNLHSFQARTNLAQNVAASNIGSPQPSTSGGGKSGTEPYLPGTENMCFPQGLMNKRQ